MVTLSIAFCVALSLLVAWTVVVPLCRSADEQPSASFSAESVNLNDQQERCIQVLKDLELDLATGKLTADEYSRMRASVGQELLGIVDKIQSLESAT